MYKLSIPVNCKTLEYYDRELIASQLKSAGAQRVFLCPEGNVTELLGEKEQKSLRDSIAFMKSKGFETGVWVWAFQYEDGDFTYMKSPLGIESKTSVCPTDMKYRQLMGDFVELVAKNDIDVLMFDDDYRYTFIDNGMSCVCDNHMRMICNELGEDVSAETMKQSLLYGRKNKYRSAFVRANGKALIDFAAEMRRRLDNVNPGIRMGFCSCISQWDIDGAHPDLIAEAFAGKTKPFYRLIGAPYWAKDKSWGNRLQDVIELERLEASRRKNEDIEIFSEGDAYPRPRFQTPAAFVEGFDTALRASCCTDGILKYMIDYSADPLTETGYLSRHIQNKSLYEKIDKMFEQKKNTGVRVFDKASKYEDINIPEAIEGTADVQNIAFNPGARLLAACSVASSYEDTPYCGIAFGDDVLAVPQREFKKGLIIDVAAAEILSEKGIDTGIRSVGETLKTGTEVFKEGNNRIGFGWKVSFRKTEIDENAITESSFIFDGTEYPGSFRYENSDGLRFLVLCFDAYFCDSGLFRNYPRARQLISAVPWLCGNKLPAVITGNPDLYVQIKENADSVAVGLWNFCPDDIPEPVVEICQNSEKISFLNCLGKLEGNKVILSRIEPYGFCAFELEK